MLKTIPKNKTKNKNLISEQKVKEQKSWYIYKKI
jgi:hypothetical protein